VNSLAWRAASTAARLEPFFGVALSSLFTWLMLRALGPALRGVDDFAVGLHGHHLSIGQRHRLQQRRIDLLQLIAQLPAIFTGKSEGKPNSGRTARPCRGAEESDPGANRVRVASRAEAADRANPGNHKVAPA